MKIEDVRFGRETWMWEGLPEYVWMWEGLPEYVWEMMKAAYALSGVAIHEDEDLTREAATFAITEARGYLDRAEAALQRVVD